MGQVPISDPRYDRTDWDTEPGIKWTPREVFEAKVPTSKINFCTHLWIPGARCHDEYTPYFYSSFTGHGNGACAKIDDAYMACCKKDLFRHQYAVNQYVLERRERYLAEIKTEHKHLPEDEVNKTLAQIEKDAEAEALRLQQENIEKMKQSMADIHYFDEPVSSTIIEPTTFKPSTQPLSSPSSSTSLSSSSSPSSSSSSASAKPNA
eukprot:TRINITY_DN8951_c0_g1_i1.p1 TRINITY_DN8951_c0_g1~~TRINITY_DN8951_c0_g1_i1.p1  ORF type:complete len:227 (-),score=58.96 TRINITY_DN8951_c0_g1_i1:246-866(-)